MFKFTMSPFFYIPFSFFYASILSQIPSLDTADFSSYLAYVYNSSSILASREFLSLGFFANEPIWLFINSLLSNFFDADTSVRIIVFFSCFLVSYILLRFYRVSFFWLVFLLFLPITIKNGIFHIRQGLAFALFFWGFSTKENPFSFLLLLSSPLIHSSFFFILSLYYTCKFLPTRSLDSRLTLLLYLVFGFFLSFFGLSLAGLYGARQSLIYNMFDVHISGLGFIPWLFVFIIFLFEGRVFLLTNLFQCSILALYLVTYFLFPFSARLFESGVILVFLSGFSLTGVRLQFFKYISCFLFLYTWSLFVVNF